MLGFILLGFGFSVLFPSTFFFPFFLSFSLLIFTLSFSYYSPLPSLFLFFTFDSYSFFLLFLAVFVLYSAYLFTLPFNQVLMSFVLFLIFTPCLFVFVSSNLLILYLFYEFSLVPIVYIIVNWGSYPERSLSALILLLYTSLFSFPLIAVLLYIYSHSFTFTHLFSFNLPPSSFFISSLIFLSFSVNLPIYGLHFWLPIAHVEAPTFGSMILAGVLLKLGGAGLVRFLPLIDISFGKSLILSYCLFFLVFSSSLCCFQSDFNRLVAYSSVAHIMSIPLLVLSSSSLSIQAILLIMVFHGLSSPILFSLVGVLYSLYSTRQLALMRGLIVLSPLLSLLCVVSFLFTLSAPPYPSFFSEVLFLLASFNLTAYVLPFFLVFIVLCLVYNLNWLSSILFVSPSYTVSPSFSLLPLPLFVVVFNHLSAILFLFLAPLF